MITTSRKNTLWKSPPGNFYQKWKIDLGLRTVENIILFCVNASGYMMIVDWWPNKLWLAGCFKYYLVNEGSWLDLLSLRLKMDLIIYNAPEVLFFLPSPLMPIQPFEGSNIQGRTRTPRNLRFECPKVEVLFHSSPSMSLKLFCIVKWNIKKKVCQI